MTLRNARRNDKDNDKVRDIIKCPEFLYLNQFPISTSLVLRYYKTVYFSGPLNKPEKPFEMLSL